MRADNNGEGGMLALAALAHRSPRLSRPIKTMIGFGAILGLALFYGDGMLTPAISVLSAVEGLTIDSHSVRAAGPAAVAGHPDRPVRHAKPRHRAASDGCSDRSWLVWFFVLAVLGIAAIVRTPIILTALNPWYAH